MNIDIHSIDGKVVGSVELPDEVFGMEPNVAVMHQAVKVYLANQRQGTHKVKGRSEVRGGGRKPWRQKGRGTARAGTTRSPLWVGGGTIHGPHPHSHRLDMPKKMRQLARRSALSLKAKANEVVVVEDFNLTGIKTKPLAQMLHAISAEGKKALILLKEPNEMVYASGRNIAKCQILEAKNASTYDLLNNQVLVIEKGSLDVLRQQFVNGSLASPATAQNEEVEA